MAISTEEFWAELDVLGDAEVRKRLARRNYSVEKHRLAEEWLRSRQEVQASIEAERDRQETRAARNWDRIAAYAGLAISLVALIVSIIK